MRSCFPKRCVPTQSCYGLCVPRYVTTGTNRWTNCTGGALSIIPAHFRACEIPGETRYFLFCFLSTTKTGAGFLSRRRTPLPVLPGTRDCFPAWGLFQGLPFALSQAKSGGGGPAAGRAGRCSEELSRQYSRWQLCAEPAASTGRGDAAPAGSELPLSPNTSVTVWR